MDSNDSVARSSIWQHFTRSDDKSTAQCIKCKKSFKTAGGSTSSLHKHLKSAHTTTIGKKTVSDSSTRPSTSCAENAVQIPKKKKRISDYYESDSNPNMETMVSRMVSLDGIPFRIFTTSFDLRYLFEKRGHSLPKSPNTIRELVIREYYEKKDEVSREIKRILSKDHKFSICFDEWSSKGNKRYLSLTLHSPEFEGASKFRSLGLLRIYGSMNARQCITVIENELQKYSINFEKDIVAQTTDGCSLMVKFGRLVHSVHQLCVAHAIQLAIIDVMYKNPEEVLRSTGYHQLMEIVERDDNEEDMTLAELSKRMRNEEVNNSDDSDDDEDDGVIFLNDAIISGEEFHESGLKYQDLIKKVRKVVKMFKKSPVKNDEVLQKHVLSDFEREYTLLLDVQTRWSSMAIMISRFLKLRGPVTKALIDLKSDVSFSEREWKTLQDIDAILNIVQTIVEVVCRRDATILTVDVAVKFALRKFLEINSDLSLQMKYALTRRYGQRRLKHVSILQYLTNPTSYFSDTDNTFGRRMSSDDMCAELEDIVRGHHGLTENMNISENSVTEPNNVISIEEELNQEILKSTCLEKPSANTGDLSVAIRLEMALYENGGQKGRYLSQAFSHLLSIQPTSVEPERIFSSAGMICNRLRTSLSDRSLMAISFLRTYFLEKRTLI